MSRTITFTRRTTATILTIAIVALAVSAAILAQYEIPTNRVRVTARPGLTAFEADGVTAITLIEWGDVQQSEFQIHTTVLRNTGGNQILYILENPTRQDTGQVTLISSLTTVGLPSGLSLTWNLADISSAFCTFGGVTYDNCYALSQGQTTAVLTMTLSASSTATIGDFTFGITFNGYSSATG